MKQNYHQNKLICGVDFIVYNNHDITYVTDMYIRDFINSWHAELF